MKKMLAQKHVLLFCLSFFICASLFAQYPKYIVQFTDKKNSPYSLNNPLAYLSQRAIDRRTRYSIALDSTDFPVNTSYVQQVLAQGSVNYLSQSKWLNQILIYCTSTATVNAIKSLPFVKSALPIGPLKSTDSTIHTDRFKETVTPLKATEKTANTAANYYGSSYPQVHIHLGEFLHKRGFTGKGMTISIIDGGFYKYKTTKAFDSARANGQFLGERDFVDFDNSVNEDADHGELCLSTIASNIPGTMVGTAPNANFWLLRGENVNSEYPIEEHNWDAAAEFADSVGTDLISSSLGYFTFDDPQFNHTYNDIYKNTTMVSKGAAFAAKKGIIVTNSAGNEGGSSWNYIIFPADTDSACSVGAVGTNGQIASFSSYGYPGKVKPNIVSVGSGTTLYAYYGLTSGSGTSFSNPNINGLIACLWQAFPKFNNMKILNAVYQSSNKYSTPDNRYGYGSPNMRLAYQILKTTQNLETYGNEWLMVKQQQFSNKIDITLIGQLDGDAHLNLINSTGKIIATQKLTTEAQEIYNTSFSDLENIEAGIYTLQYADNKMSKSISLVKEGIIAASWLQASPVPFKTNLTATISAPESGSIMIQLTDVRGKIWETQQLKTVKDKTYSIQFLKAAAVPPGIYFIQYKGINQNKSLSVQKQ